MRSQHPRFASSLIISCSTTSFIIELAAILPIGQVGRSIETLSISVLKDNQKNLFKVLDQSRDRSNALQISLITLLAIVRARKRVTGYMSRLDRLSISTIVTLIIVRSSYRYILGKPTHLIAFLIQVLYCDLIVIGNVYYINTWL